MPKIISIGAYGLIIHTGREVNVPHVHIEYQGREVLWNLLMLREYGECPFRVPKKVRQYIEEHQIELLELWDKYHAG